MAKPTFLEKIEKVKPLLITMINQCIMAFKKGISGNPTGRPKGRKDKATSNLRDWINEFINDNREQIEKDWKLLEPKERLLMFEKLLRYSLPTLQATSLDVNFEQLTDEDLDTIIDKLKNAESK